MVARNSLNSLRDSFVSGIGRNRVQFAHSARVTVAAMLSFVAGKILGVPLVLWPVLTAIVLTQLSIGKSLKAIINYFIGTLGGAAYAALIALLIPHAKETIIRFVVSLGHLGGNSHPHLIATLVPQTANLALGFTLVIVLAPLAFLAALNPKFSAAPFTGALIVLIPTIAHVSPLASAFDRILEVGLGGVIALLVSLVIFPARAHEQVNEEAAKLLGLMARVVPELFSSFTSSHDAITIQNLQRTIGGSFPGLNEMVGESNHERKTLLMTGHDARPLVRALLRLRHDLIMLGRAAVIPLPDSFKDRLGSLLDKISETTVVHLDECATALTSGKTPFFMGNLDEAFEKFSSEMLLIRKEGILLQCSFDTVEHLFTLGFALEQMHQNLSDLEERVKEYTDSPEERSS